MDAAKSAGPKMIVSTRGEAAQISSTLMRPRVVSICASMPMWPTGRPAFCSTCVSSMSRAMTSAADCTFGSITSSRRSPALPTTSMTSPYVHLVSHALTRTQSTRSPQSRFLMASTTLARAASFSSGATESSRSRNVMSAGTEGPLARKRSLEPGTDRHDRRGRLRLRSDMPEMLGAPLRDLRNEVEGRQLFGDQAAEAVGVTGHEPAAEWQPLHVAGDVGAPGGVGEELHRLLGPGAREQRPPLGV